MAESEGPPTEGRAAPRDGPAAAAEPVAAEPGVAASTTLPSTEALETSKLLVELLHAAYATRREPTAAGQEVAGVRAGATAGPHEGPHGGDAAHVSPHAIRAAIHVYQHGSRTVGQIATGLGISYGWASRVVDELESAGYLIRERDDTDRRVVRVRLRPAAIEEVEQAYRWRGDVVERALDPLTPNEREAVRRFLRRVVDGLQSGGAGER